MLYQINHLQLQTFILIAQEKNFSKVAEMMHTSQPTISERIQSLENELGVTLFHRTKRSVALSPQGKIFLPYAKKLLELTDEAVGKMKSGENVANVRMGMVNPFITYVLPHLLPRMYRQIHDLNMEVVKKMSSTEIINMVKEGKLELAFVTESLPDESLIETIPLYKERFVMLSNPSHPLTKLPKVRYADFRSYTFVVIDPTSSIYKHVHHFLTYHNIMPDNVIEISSVAAIKELIKDGDMITLLPELFVKEELERGLIASISLSPEPPMLTTSLVYSKQFGRKDIIEVIVEEVKDILKNTIKL